MKKSKSFFVFDKTKKVFLENKSRPSPVFQPNQVSVSQAHWLTYPRRRKQVTSTHGFKHCVYWQILKSPNEEHNTLSLSVNSFSLFFIASKKNEGKILFITCWAFFKLWWVNCKFYFQKFFNLSFQFLFG